MPRWRALSSMSCACAMAFLRDSIVDVLAMRQLLLDDVDLVDVLEPARPRPGLQAHHAAGDFSGALQQQQRAGQRDHELEMVDRRTVRGHVGMLVDAPGVGGVVPAGIGQSRDAGQEEHDVEHEIERGLGARPHRRVEKVAADMGVLRQRIGAADHEQRAVQHVGRVEDPGRRHVENIALENLGADQHHQSHDQPGGGLAEPSADAVDGVQETLRVHGVSGPPVERGRQNNNADNRKHHPGFGHPG